MATPLVVLLCLTLEEMWRHDRNLDRLVAQSPAFLEAQRRRLNWPGTHTIHALDGRIEGDSGSGLYCSYYAVVTVSLPTLNQDKVDAIAERARAHAFEPADPSAGAHPIHVSAFGEAPYLTVHVADEGYGGMLDPRCG